MVSYNQIVHVYGRNFSFDHFVSQHQTKYLKLPFGDTQTYGAADS